MYTSCNTTMGPTWTGESWTTLYVSAVGAGLLLSQQSGIPRHPEQWGAVSRESWPQNGEGFLVGVGTPRDPPSSPTSLSQRCWVSAGTKRSGPGLPGACNSGRGVCKQAWWGPPRRKEPPGRAGPPLAAKMRTTPWPGITMKLYCLVSFGRPSVGQLTGRGWGVSSRTTNARKPGNRLQRSSRRNT